MTFFLKRGRHAQLHPYPLPSLSGIPKARHVTFDRVEIRVHALILSDHPSCSDGMALGLGWEHAPKKRVMHIDDFENTRKDRRPFDRLSAKERKHRLKKAGGVRERDLKKAFDDSRCTIDEIVKI
jgi:hypothetical protein